MSCELQLDERFEFDIARQLAELLEYLGIGTFRRGTMELTSAELGLKVSSWDTNQVRRGRWTQRIEGYVTVRLTGRWRVLSCFDQYDDSKINELGY